MLAKRVRVYNISSLDFNAVDLEFRELCEYSLRYYDYEFTSKLRDKAVRYDSKSSTGIYGFSECLWSNSGHLITLEQFKEYPDTGLKNVVEKALSGNALKYLCFQFMEE